MSSSNTPKKQAITPNERQSILRTTITPPSSTTSGNHPDPSLSSSSSSSVTQRKLSHLNSQMAQLNANLCDFNDLLVTTCSQYQSIEKLGKIHASIFMAGHTVFEDENFN